MLYADARKVNAYLRPVYADFLDSDAYKLTVLDDLERTVLLKRPVIENQSTMPMFDSR